MRGEPALDASRPRPRTTRSSDGVRRAHSRGPSDALVQLRLFTAGLLEPHRVGPGLLVLFEGFDAAGKGGAIRRLTASLDPRHVRVVPDRSARRAEELRHHFLWRFQPSLPGAGEMTVYDRSWYGRLLVERVEGLIDDDEAASVPAARSSSSSAASSTTASRVVKFWLHISDDEQLTRFKDRASDPLKQWKLTADDWRNREKRPAYLERAATTWSTSTDRRHTPTGT